MRLALVSPLPPEATGIADYSIDVSRALRERHDVDLFHSDLASASVGNASPVSSLPTRNSERPYDAVVYQIGNGPAHDFQYDAMTRTPGIVVLHDLVLHHARSRIHLQSDEVRAYAADPSNATKRDRALERLARYDEEANAAYPGAGARLREAHLNTAGDLLLFSYPFFHEALRHATAAGAHNEHMVRAIAEERSGLPARRVAMPMEAVGVDPGRVASRRTALGFAPSDFVVGCFGLVTREKRVDSVARAIARVSPHLPGARLLLVGPIADRAWLDGVLQRNGLRERAVVTDRVPLDDLPEYMGSANAVAHLRWPTARETSAALLRVLAQGRPCFVADLQNQSEIPDDAAVRIDVTDEEGGLARGILALARDPGRAARIGERAAAYVRREHSLEATLTTYEALIRCARAA